MESPRFFIRVLAQVGRLRLIPNASVEAEQSIVLATELCQSDDPREGFAVLEELAELKQSPARPPGNRLERLKGDRNGQWSIRINNQWRICFYWQGQHAFDVEITDYH